MEEKREGPPNTPDKRNSEWVELETQRSTGLLASMQPRRADPPPAWKENLLRPCPCPSFPPANLSGLEAPRHSEGEGEGATCAPATPLPAGRGERREGRHQLCPSPDNAGGFPGAGLLGSGRGAGSPLPSVGRSGREGSSTDRSAGGSRGGKTRREEPGLQRASIHKGAEPRRNARVMQANGRGVS